MSKPRSKEPLTEDKIQRLVYAEIVQVGPKGIERWFLHRALHFSERDFNSAIDALIAQGAITVEIVKTGGPSKVIYKAK